jgi:hypothetical protein
VRARRVLIEAAWGLPLRGQDLTAARRQLDLRTDDNYT